MGNDYFITGENDASNNGVIIAVTVVAVVAGVLIIVAIIVSTIIIRQKKLKCTYYETDHKGNISEEIPEYADVVSVQLRSTATQPPPPLPLPLPPPPRMPGTSLETNTMSDPDVDRNPAYGQFTPPSIDMQNNPAYERIQTQGIPSSGGGYGN